MIAENGLSLITVKKSELLEALKKNRETHRGMFIEAQKGYRVAVIEELDAMLADAKSGKNIKKQVLLETPQDHTKDYDKIIRMLEMSVNDEIKISDKEFSHFVLDDWSWKNQFVETSNSYMNKVR